MGFKVKDLNDGQGRQVSWQSACQGCAGPGCGLWHKHIIPGLWMQRQKIRSSSSGKMTLKVEHLLPDHEDHRNPPQCQLGAAAHLYLQPQKADTESAGQQD